MPSLHHNHPEAAERSEPLALSWRPKYADRFHAQPQPWIEAISRAKEMQLSLGISDGDFAGAILNGSAWNQLCNGAYRLPTTSRGIEQISDKLRLLVKRGTELLQKRAETGSRARALAERFVLRPEYSEVLGCLSDSDDHASQGLEERVTFIVGDTRAGKSAMLAKLKAEGKVHWHLRGTEDLKRSYKQFLMAIGRTLGLRDLMDSKRVKTGDTWETVSVFPCVSTLRQRILVKLGKTRGVLAIEEVQSFSGAALEFLKSLLNDTQVSLILCMVPGQFARLVNSVNEDRKQFLGRSVGVIRLQVTPELVRDMEPRLWRKCPEAAELQRLIAVEAEKGGGMSLVRDVVRDVGLLGEDGVKREHVTNALELFRLKIPAMRRAAALQVKAAA